MLILYNNILIAGILKLTNSHEVGNLYMFSTSLKHMDDILCWLILLFERKLSLFGTQWCPQRCPKGLISHPIGPTEVTDSTRTW